MFFYLSKVFWFLAQPLNLAILLLAVALLAAWQGRRRTGLTITFAALLTLSLSAWTSLGAVLLTPLEERFPRPAAMPPKVDGVIVLGGGFEGAINLSRSGYELNDAGDRFVEAAILARRYPEARVVVTGGTGSLVLDGEGDADTAPRLLEALGVARERLVLETKSRDTYENALFTRALVDPRPGETWLLVTSAFHMPRSMALFRKAGFGVTPWPTDFRTSGREGIGLFRDNTQDALRNATTAMREWIGLVAYRVSGRTDELLPAP